MDHYSIVREQLPKYLNPPHHILSEHKYINRMFPSNMHYHQESGDSHTKRLPLAETVMVRSDAKDKEEDERFYEYYSKSDDVFED